MREPRRQWESKWSRPTDVARHFELDYVPRQLIAHCEEHGPIARALDLGCGSGLTTVYLAQECDVVVGMDFAESAVRRAKKRADLEGTKAHFVVADVTRLPIRADAVQLVFDRGCLQGIAPALWPRYLTEAEATLVRNGHLLVLASLPPPAPIWTKRFWKRRVNLHRRFRRSCPSGLRIERLEDLPVPMRNDVTRVFTEALFRRA